MPFSPDFSRGLGPAADQQILLANCLQRRFEEDMAASQSAFEAAQARSGSFALLGASEGAPIPGQSSSGPEDFSDWGGTSVDGREVVLSRP